MTTPDANVPPGAAATESDAQSSVDVAFAPLIAKYATKGGPPPAPGSDRLAAYRAYRDEFARARTLRFDIGGHHYQIEVPPPEFVFERLRADQPFAFGRLTHGHFDALALRDRIAAEPQLATLPQPERQVLAGRIAQRVKPFDGSFVEGFLDEMEDLTRRHRGDPRFFNAVAFKGYPTPDDELFAPDIESGERADRLERLARLFGPRDRLLDANLWKRLAYSGHLLTELPQCCAGRHVILIGRDYFSDLDQRWPISRLTHLKIPRRLTHQIRWQLLSELRPILAAAVREGEPRPVVITQCGAVAYWLVSHLFTSHPNVFYLDLGQALDIWFTDLKDVGAAMWMRYYAATK